MNENYYGIILAEIGRITFCILKILMVILNEKAMGKSGGIVVGKVPSFSPLLGLGNNNFFFPMDFVVDLPKWIYLIVLFMQFQFLPSRILFVNQWISVNF